jgi:hypothetical protein
MATAQSSTQVLRFPALPTGRIWKRATVKRALAGHTLYGAALILMTAGFILLGDGLSVRTER